MQHEDPISVIAYIGLVSYTFLIFVGLAERWIDIRVKRWEKQKIKGGAK